MTYSIEEKRAIVALLTKMMFADGRADISEEAYLLRIKQILNYPNWNSNQSMNTECALSVVQSMNDDKKMEVVGMLQQMIMADGIKDNNEMFLFGQIVTSTGIDKAIERKTSGLNIHYNDALIYCRSSKIALAKRSAEYLAMIKEQAGEFQRYFLYNSKSFDEICEMIASYSKDSVKHSGWDVNDIDGATWFLGNFTDAMLKAGAINDYDSAFQKAFSIYFK